MTSNPQRLGLRRPEPAIPTPIVIPPKIPQPSRPAKPPAHQVPAPQAQRPQIAVVVGILGAVLLIAGLIFGFSTVSADHADVTCGSAFAPDYSSADNQASVDNLASAYVAEAGGGYSAAVEYRSLCDTALPTTRTPAILLIALGAVTLIGLGLILAAAQQRRAGQTSSRAR